VKGRSQRQGQILIGEVGLRVGKGIKTKEKSAEKEQRDLGQTVVLRGKRAKREKKREIEEMLARSKVGKEKEETALGTPGTMKGWVCWVFVQRVRGGSLAKGMGTLGGGY